MAPIHCWKSYLEFIYGQGHEIGSPLWVEAFEHPATCMLPAGHDGDHEWTKDEDIGVEFRNHG